MNDREIRARFWHSLPEPLLVHARITNGRTRPRFAEQNQQPAEIRQAFVEFVDALHKCGIISGESAERITL